MNHLPARARLFLFLLVVAAPLTATLAFERAAGAPRPARVELRDGGSRAPRSATAADSRPLAESVGSKSAR
jgi:hypothetical protein